MELISLDHLLLSQLVLPLHWLKSKILLLIYVTEGLTVSMMKRKGCIALGLWTCFKQCKAVVCIVFKSQDV